MKRKSTLILIAALILIVTIPVFAFAAGNGNGSAMNTGSSTRMFGRGNTAAQPAAVQQGTQLMLQDCDEEDCDCEVQGTGLGADGEALHQYARVADSTRLYQKFSSGAQSFAGRGANQAFINCPLAE